MYTSKHIHKRRRTADSSCVFRRKKLDQSLQAKNRSYKKLKIQIIKANSDMYSNQTLSEEFHHELNSLATASFSPRTYQPSLLDIAT